MQLTVYLIKPSLYDEDGYVIRFRRGVLPSNTLACLNGLLHGLPEKQLPGLRVSTYMYDEIVDRVDPARLADEARTAPGPVLFFLCGVQTNMLPRATDIARILVAAGQTVLLGGFHVSGVMAIFDEPDADMRDLLEMGVTLVAGEVEETLGDLIRDALAARLRPLYNFLAQKPALDTGHLPRVESSYLKKFALPAFSTLDLGRGCPYRCSFCTIINVHGNSMRARDLDFLRARLIHNYDELGISYYFFTDDNMARHPHCEDVLTLLRDLRSGGRKITFMMQADVLAYRKGFAERAAAAGCTQVFLGMESLNPRNLSQAGKRQNRVEEYRDMIACWQSLGIMTHVGYIIGFPYDTLESVKRDIHMLADEIGVDLASFFMLTPLPGSRDHQTLIENGAPLDPDFNRFDSFHAVTDHPMMTRAEWHEAYQYAWSYFYSRRRMERTLARLSRSRFKDMWGSYLWYSYARRVQDLHPMVCGFGRIKRRAERRYGAPREGALRFASRRLADGLRGARRWSEIATNFGWLYAKHMLFGSGAQRTPQA